MRCLCLCEMPLDEMARTRCLYIGVFAGALWASSSSPRLRLRSFVTAEGAICRTRTLGRRTGAGMRSRWSLNFFLLIKVSRVRRIHPRLGVLHSALSETRSPARHAHPALRPASTIGTEGERSRLRLIFGTSDASREAAYPLHARWTRMPSHSSLAQSAPLRGPTGARRPSTSPRTRPPRNRPSS